MEKREKTVPLWKSSLIVNFMISMIVHLPLRGYVSVNSMPDHPRATPGDSHILVALGVGFLLLCLARGVLNQSKSSITLKKARFLLCLLNK